MPDANTQSGGNGATDGAQPSVATSETGKISGLRIESFAGSRNPQVYKDWKRSVEAVRFISDLAPGKLAVIAYLSLSGEARDLTRHIELEELQDSNGLGLKKLYMVLDKRYLKQEHEQYDYYAAKYEKFRRARGMSMQEYLTSLARVKTEYEVADAGASVSDKAFARKMLKCAGLSRDECRSVLAAAGQLWDYEKIESGLVMMFGDAHLDDNKHRDRHLAQVPTRTRNARGRGGGPERDHDVEHGQRGSPTAAGPTSLIRLQGHGVTNKPDIIHLQLELGAAQIFGHREQVG